MALQRSKKSSPCVAERGFTLMELIIVCSLIGILLSFAIPTLKNTLITNQLDTTARKLIGTIKELRNLAVREHRAYLLHFEIDANTYWYEEDGTLDPFHDEPQNVRELPEGVRLADIQMHSQGTINSGKATLWISKKGYMDRTVVHLSNEDGQQISLFFSPFSGSARVYDDYVEAE